MTATCRVQTVELPVLPPGVNSCFVAPLQIRMMKRCLVFCPVFYFRYDEWIKADKIVRPANKNVPKIKHRKKIKVRRRGPLRFPPSVSHRETPDCAQF